MKKKHNAISYHKIREAVAAGIVLYAWIQAHINLYDLLTKTLGGKSFMSLIWFLLFGKGSRYVKGSDNNGAQSDEITDQTSNVNKKSEHITDRLDDTSETG